MPIPASGKAASRPRPTRILASTDIVSSPAWSPDGTRIAYSTEPNHYSGSIQAIDANGASQPLTTAGTYHDLNPAWSPDGRYLAFVSEQLGHLKLELFVKAIPGDSPASASPSTQLTGLDGRTWQPAWSPDGTRIVVASALEGQGLDLYLLTVPTQAGGALPELVRLTDHPADDEHPSWAPLP
jgi:TolB protein